MPQQEPDGGNMDPKVQELQRLIEIENVKDFEQREAMFNFSGAWTPTIDATLIGPENFASLVNMRYNDAGIEGVNGYTLRNTTALVDYTNISNGIFLKTQGRTQENYTLVYSYDSTPTGRIYVNKTAIGTTGDFATGIGEQAAGSRPDYLHEDANADLVGRFSKCPGENIAFANGEEVHLWSGEESTIASAFTTSDGAEATPIDVTEKLINKRSDAANIIDLGTTYDFITIMTTRPVHGFKIYVSSANTSTATLAVKYWNGTAYAAVSNLVDNTATTGWALNKTGTVTFDSTVSTAKLHHFQERYLYSYQIELPAGAADLYQITAQMPMQAPSNIWDGVYRTPIQAQVYTASTTSYEDFTLHVAESSTVNVPVGAILDGMVATNDAFYMMFDEPMAGVKLTMLGQLVNLNASVMTMYYWNGAAWTALTSGSHAWVDGSAAAGKTFGSSGVITWNPPTDEEKTTLFGTQGFGYKIVVSVTLSDATAGKSTEDIVIDLITGIPAPAALPTFKFPTQYKSRLFLCNYEQGNEGNRIDYSIDNAPDIFNGNSSSLDGYQSIFVGGSEHITCAAQIYNRFGSNLFSSLAIFKANELYLLTGDSPVDYQLFPVSYTLGCPAPQSLVTAEVGFELGENVARNVSMFVSNSGPMMYDGAVLYPIRGMEKYFDPNESIAVNFTYLNTAKGWYDATYKEYNILLPTGSSTTLNTWLCYDMVRKKWFQKSVGTSEYVTCGFNVSADNGDQYIYGGTGIGQMAQLENGTSWGGGVIDNEIQTADFFPNESEWDITRIRRLKFVSKRTQENDTDVNYWHFVDTNAASGLLVNFVDAATSYTNSGVAGYEFTDVVASIADSGVAGFNWNASSSDVIDISQSGNTRIVRSTNILNQAGWSHSFKFLYSSSTTPKGLQPIMWGVQFEVVRKDY